MSENIFLETVELLLDAGDLSKARELTYEEINSYIVKDEESLLYSIKIYCILIDIGSITNNEPDINFAIDYFETNEPVISLVIERASNYYNIGNAYSSLASILVAKTRGVPTIEIVKDQLQQPIRFYWLAYKSLNQDNKKDLEFKILINLANSLSTAGRVVEALQYLDTTLRSDPNFPEALISRADTLHWICVATNCNPSIAFYAQIYNSYNLGILSNKLPQDILARSVYGRDEALQKIESHGFNIDHIHEEIKESNKQFDDHTPFRKFCIENFITLNEHGLYCNCVVVKKDTLQIGIQNIFFKGEHLPKLELLLNRIKTEFSLSRWMFYQFYDKTIDIEFDNQYSELLDGEILDSKTEMLRTSYRICYGILDKIAHGICKLYNIKLDHIHFESFWYKDKVYSLVKDKKNIHLTALYSISSDLNNKEGELKEFKSWRNNLEHNLLILKKHNPNDIDILNLYEDTKFVEIIDIDEFRIKTLRLLQLTRAAIFSFVYCVRLEYITLDSPDDNSPTFTVEIKKQ